MSRSVHAIYCDDVRPEVGGKVSFMGCYDNLMIVPSFPVSLRNFVVYAVITTEIDNPFKFLTVELWSSDQVLASHDINPEVVHDESDPRKGPFTFAYYTVWFPFSPFTISEATALRVVARCEAGELRSGALEILAQPEGMG